MSRGNFIGKFKSTGTCTPITGAPIILSNKSWSLLLSIISVFYFSNSNSITEFSFLVDQMFYRSFSHCSLMYSTILGNVCS